MRRKPGGTGHALPASIDPYRVIDHQPTPLVVTDANGVVVYRNETAAASLAELEREGRTRIIERLRTEIKRLTTGTTSFPVSTVVAMSDKGKENAVEIMVTALPDGYLCNWRDITAEYNRAEALRATADDLAATAVTFEELSGQLATSGDQVSTKMETVSTAVEEFVASIANISASSAAAATNAGTAVSAADTATARISRLNESSVQVETVSKLINGIAEQTNLLALNATIEAARAGAAGKGFAVVAGEVKDLASRTSEATERIASIIQAIRTDIDSTATSIAEIVGVIDRVRAEETTIAGAVEEQATTAGEIRSSVASAAATVDASARTSAELHSTADSLRSKAESLRSLV